MGTFQSDSPADKSGDDDAPGGAAAVGVGCLLALFASAAEPDGVEEEEEEVQSEARQCHCSHQQDGLSRTKAQERSLSLKRTHWTSR